MDNTKKISKKKMPTAAGATGKQSDLAAFFVNGSSSNKATPSTLTRPVTSERLNIDSAMAKLTSSKNHNNKNNITSSRKPISLKALSENPGGASRSSSSLSLPSAHPSCAAGATPAAKKPRLIQKAAMIKEEKQEANQKLRFQHSTPPIPSSSTLSSGSKAKLGAVMSSSLSSSIARPLSSTSLRTTTADVMALGTKKKVLQIPPLKEDDSCTPFRDRMPVSPDMKLTKIETMDPDDDRIPLPRSPPTPPSVTAVSLSRTTSSVNLISHHPTVVAAASAPTIDIDQLQATPERKRQKSPVRTPESNSRIAQKRAAALEAEAERQANSGIHWEFTRPTVHDFVGKIQHSGLSNNNTNSSGSSLTRSTTYDDLGRGPSTRNHLGTPQQQQRQIEPFTSLSLSVPAERKSVLKRGRTTFRRHDTFSGSPSLAPFLNSSTQPVGFPRFGLELTGKGSQEGTGQEEKSEEEQHQHQPSAKTLRTGLTTSIRNWNSQRSPSELVKPSRNNIPISFSSPSSTLRRASSDLGLKTPPKHATAVSLSSSSFQPLQKPKPSPGEFDDFFSDIDMPEDDLEEIFSLSPATTTTTTTTGDSTQSNLLKLSQTLLSETFNTQPVRCPPTLTAALSSSSSSTSPSLSSWSSPASTVALSSPATTLVAASVPSTSHLSNNTLSQKPTPSSKVFEKSDVSMATVKERRNSRRVSFGKSGVVANNNNSNHATDCNATKVKAEEVKVQDEDGFDFGSDIELNDDDLDEDFGNSAATFGSLSSNSSAIPATSSKDTQLLLLLNNNKSKKKYIRYEILAVIKNRKEAELMMIPTDCFPSSSASGNDTKVIWVKEVGGDIESIAMKAGTTSFMAPRHVVQLRDEWAQTKLCKGDIVHIIDSFPAGSTTTTASDVLGIPTFTSTPTGTTTTTTTTSSLLPIVAIDQQIGYLILHPDTLISTSVLADSFSCLRKSVLDQQIQTPGHFSRPMTHGTVIHELFQSALQNPDLFFEEPESKEMLNLLKQLIHQHLQEFCLVQETAEDAFQELKKLVENGRIWAKKFLKVENGDDQSWVKKEDIGSIKTNHATTITTTTSTSAKTTTTTTTKEAELFVLEAGQRSLFSVSIERLLDIEENIWSPMFGLKGKIDATVQVRTRVDRRHPKYRFFEGRDHDRQRASSNDSNNHWNDNEDDQVLVVPLELKTGKTSNLTSHRAQTMLYTLLMRDRYDMTVDFGLLYYMKMNQFIRVKAARLELVAILMKRNEMAGYLVLDEQEEPQQQQQQQQVGMISAFVLNPLAVKPSTSTTTTPTMVPTITTAATKAGKQRLPDMLGHFPTCRRCWSLSTCTVVHKLSEEQGTDETSGLLNEGLFDTKTAHLNQVAHSVFYQKWMNLITLEFNGLSKHKSLIWTSLSKERQLTTGQCLAGLELVGPAVVATTTSTTEEDNSHRRNNDDGNLKKEETEVDMEDLLLPVDQDTKSNNTPTTTTGFTRHRYRFRVPTNDSDNNNDMDDPSRSFSQLSMTSTPGSPKNLLDSSISVGDPIVVSSESGHYALAVGFVQEISMNEVIVRVDRPLYGPPLRRPDFESIKYQNHFGIQDMKNSNITATTTNATTTTTTTTAASRKHLLGELSQMEQGLELVSKDGLLAKEQRSKIRFRIDKDEMSAGLAKARNNIVQLFRAPEDDGDAHRRRLIVDLEPPVYCYEEVKEEEVKASGRIVKTEENDEQKEEEEEEEEEQQEELNEDQHEAIRTVMAAQDYALILGMPGTGKTTTIVELIYRLVKNGKTVLLTSYTHSAVDNLMLKLKEKKSFMKLMMMRNSQGGMRPRGLVRLGTRHRVHEDILEFVPDFENDSQLQTVYGIDQFYNGCKVVGTTALGVHDMLLQARNKVQVQEDKTSWRFGTESSNTYNRQQKTNNNNNNLDNLEESDFFSKVGEGFDYCIVDEASQLTLPICLGPLRLAKKFVLVGDHFQLPPLVKNPLARQGGFDVSLFKLLSKQKFPGSLCKLRYQYRMNQDIMTVSNLLIYENQLKCASDSVAVKKLMISKESRDQALRFMHSDGQGIDDGTTGSIIGSSGSSEWICQNSHTSIQYDSSSCWLEQILDQDRSVIFVDMDKVPEARETRVGDMVRNPAEARFVYEAVEALLRAGIKAKDIGVISVYRAQLRVISRLFGRGGGGGESSHGHHHHHRHRHQQQKNRGFKAKTKNNDNDDDIEDFSDFDSDHGDDDDVEDKATDAHSSPAATTPSIDQRYKNLDIHTVDRYQGKDKDCVIVSLVRSNPDHQLGQLLKDWRRLNVAFTRAKKKLIIFGSQSTLRNGSARLVAEGNRGPSQERSQHYQKVDSTVKGSGGGGGGGKRGNELGGEHGNNNNNNNNNNKDGLFDTFLRLMNSKGWILTLPPKSFERMHWTSKEEDSKLLMKTKSLTLGASSSLQSRSLFSINTPLRSNNSLGNHNGNNNKRRRSLIPLELVGTETNEMDPDSDKENGLREKGQTPPPTSPPLLPLPKVSRVSAQAALKRMPIVQNIIDDL